MRLSFVYPMYNEIGNIEKVVRSTHAIGKKLLGDFEIVVVDDCSTDGCGELADRLARELPELRVIHHERNRKLGGTLKTGFAAAKMDHILYMDSDIPVAFEDVEACLAELDSVPDILIGFRIGRAEGVFRDVQSWGYNTLLRTVFGLKVRDANFAFKLFRREVVSRSLHSEGSFIDAEMLLEALKRGYTIQERGFLYHVRTAGVSTLGSPKVIPQLLGDLFYYWRRRWRAPVDGTREVIFNADDFGLCKSINDGVIESHEKGVVSSASIMATGEAFDEAAKYAAQKKTLDVGLHLALCDGRPVCDAREVPSLVNGDGKFHAGYAAFIKSYFAGKIVMAEVEKEFRAQLAKARAAGLEISHLDSHQHLHALPAILEIVIRLAKEHGIAAIRYPDERDVEVVTAILEGRTARSIQRMGLSMVCRSGRRMLNGSGLSSTDHFFGVMEAGRWNNKSLRQTISSLKPGVTEICVHPRSEPAPEKQYDWGYNFAEELATLASDGLKTFIEEQNVRLTSFRDCFAK
ncbi:MAG TPA: ChbG/HpnK family deacetylase [Chthoniobacteraceae bacterium]|nr:ChbG/HpnK family deacetylase [Chthoniobacteraceae bacterium]